MSSHEGEDKCPLTSLLFMYDFLSLHCRIKFVSVGSTNIPRPGTYVR